MPTDAHPAGAPLPAGAPVPAAAPLPAGAPLPSGAPLPAAASDQDVVIVGGGHNGLTAAAYLARAGKRVLLLERDDHVGGAAVSAEAFDGVDARLSRYSYLVSLLPQRIIDDLGLDVRLVRRRFSSYTPDPRDPSRGLLVDNEADAAAARTAFARVGAEADAESWQAFSADTARVAEALFPTLTEPLPTRAEARARVGDDGARAALARELQEHVRARLSKHKYPRWVVFVDELPRNDRGKVDKKALAARDAAGELRE
jgi:phytoene dehydrogenase-like protein